MDPIRIHSLQFDENLPLYGWQEEADFYRSGALSSWPRNVYRSERSTKGNLIAIPNMLTSKAFALVSSTN
jgi:hypothetical protein